MDVRCERCSTEYEFDASRIPEEGLAVKCSSCGHVFRVSAPDAGSAQPRNGDWMVRQASGNVFTFKELTTLQRWIVERKVFREDEISKAGKQWKRLGDIAELATFFQVVDAQARPPAAYPQQIPLQPQAAAPGPYPQQAVYPAPLAPPPVAAYPQAPAAWAQPNGALQQDSQPSLPVDPPDFYDDLPVRRGGKAKWVLLMLLLVAGGGAGAAYHLRPSLFRGLLGGPDQRAVDLVQAGYTSLYRDSYGAIDDAISSFEQAIAVDPRYADARAGLCEAQLARAEYVREEADELFDTLAKLSGQEREAVTTSIEAKRSEAARRSEKAFEAAKEALRLDPGALAGNRAMADYYRYKKAPEQMQPLAERAKGASPNDPGLAYVMGASLMDDAAAAERAIRYLEAAVAGNPAMQRARYALARVYAAQGEKDEARKQLDTILGEVPDHERAKALAARLETPAPAQPQEPEQQPEETSEQAPAVEAAPPKAQKTSFMQLVRTAVRLRESDQASKALPLYEQAKEMEPEDPDVHTGIGWCYVDLEEPDAAIRSFEAALRYAPRLSDAHMGMAEAFRMKGDKKNAIEHYQAYLDIMPSGSEASVARRMIKLLQD